MTSTQTPRQATPGHGCARGRALRYLLVGVLGLWVLAAPAGPWIAPAWAKGEDPATVRRAEGLATEAKLLFQQKAYEAAAERFMEAYTLVQRASLVYNAARAYQEAGNLQKALALFRAYVGLSDAPEDGKTDARGRIAALEASIKAQEPKPEPKPEPRPEPRPEPKVQAPPGGDPVAVRPAEAATPTANVGPKSENNVHAPQAPVVVQERKAPPAPAKFPWAAAAASGGMALCTVVLYSVALSEANAAHDMEATLHTSQEALDYQGHEAKAQTLRGAAVATGVLTAVAGGWLAWAVYSAGQPAETAPESGAQAQPVRASWQVVPLRDGAAVTAGLRW